MLNKLQLNDGTIIGGDRTFVIAEIGSNHGQDLKRAFDTIDAAAECGVDAVKFQSIQIDELYFQPSEQTRSLHKLIDLDESWHLPLKDRCEDRNVLFFSSPTYVKAVDLLESLDVALYKLASAQVGTFPQLIERVANTGKPCLLSTGIATYSEVERAVQIFEASGNQNYAIFHCNSIYPTPPERVFLQRMEAYRQMFQCPVGFSDHTEGIAVPIAAVASGAAMIEKHFILEKDSIKSPDASFSLEPEQMAEMVSGIRMAESANRAGARVSLELEESRFKDSIRYRVFLNRNIREGEVLGSEDFDFRRHPTGVDAVELPDLLKRRCTATCDIPKKSILNYGSFRVE